MANLRRQGVSVAACKQPVHNDPPRGCVRRLQRIVRNQQTYRFPVVPHSIRIDVLLLIYANARKGPSPPLAAGHSLLRCRHPQAEPIQRHRAVTETEGAFLQVWWKVQLYLCWHSNAGARWHLNIAFMMHRRS